MTSEEAFSDPLLARLEQQARDEHIPIVDRAEAPLLLLLSRLVRPGLIVELGTATGYSAIWLLRGWPQANLLTFELDADLARQAKENLAEAGLADRAEVRTENAVDALNGMAPASAGLIFNDILNGLRDEQRVEECFAGVIRLLRPGGLLLTDNATERGEVVGEQTRVARCVRRWNQLVTAESSLTSTILPVGDGLSIAVRRER